VTKICATKNLYKNFEKALYFLTKNPKSAGIFFILKGKNMPIISLFIEGNIPLIFQKDTNKKC
jgi:hypothetical protein